MTDQTTTREITCDARFAAVARERVEKANRRAAKIGATPYTLTVTAAEPRKIYAENTRRVIGTVAQVTLTLTGEVPKIAGWTFAGTLTFDEVSGACIVRAVPGLELNLGNARPRAQWCDYCNTDRYRTDTYLLRSDDGAFKQVGSTCIADFLGVEVNLGFWTADLLEGADDDLGGWSGGWGGCDRYVIEDLLADTLALQRAFGWVSAGQARDDDRKISTRSRLEAANSNARDTDRGYETLAGESRRGIAENRLDGDAELAATILTWVREELTGDGDYVVNLQAAVAATQTLEDGTVLNTCDARNVGLVISAVSVYQREVEKRAARVLEDSKPSEWVGEVKQRLRGVTGEIVTVRYLDGQYGTTTLLIWKDADGNVFKWFASGTKNYSVGDTISVDGTVKALETYDGRKSTALTRCTILEGANA